MPVTKTDVRRHPPCSCCIGRGRGMFQAAGYCGAPFPYAGWRDGYAGLACCIVSLNNHRQVKEFWSIKLIIWSLALLWSCDYSSLQRQTLGQVLGAGILPWAWTWEALLQSRLYKLLMIAKTHALPWRRVFVFRSKKICLILNQILFFSMKLFTQNTSIYCILGKKYLITNWS